MGERGDEEEEQRGRGPLHFLRSRRAAEKALGAYPVSTSSRVKSKEAQIPLQGYKSILSLSHILGVPGTPVHVYTCCTLN